MQAHYDNNDTVLTSQWYIDAMAGTPEQQDAAEKAAECDGTPTVVHLDTLARAFYTIQHNRLPDSSSPPVWVDYYYESYVELDIQGNHLATNDARGLTPLTCAYNMLQALVRHVSIDSGVSVALHDVEGSPLYLWDAEYRQFHFTYDELRRRLTKQVTSSSPATTKVLELNVYGEGQPDDTVYNLRRELYQVYDGAGLETIADYDFKGNKLSFIRQFVEDPTQTPDWIDPGSVSMETEEYTGYQTYDALDRTLTITTPDTGITTYAYEETGMMFSVRVDNIGDGLGSPPYSLSSEIVNEIYYDALGRRVKIKYENGATTTYEYDPYTFRVTRILTTRSSDSAVLQDLNYWYDPVGNIIIQEDAAQEDVYFSGTVASPDNNYTYDALYRLIIGQGRELAGNNAAPTYDDDSRTGITPVPISSTDTAAMRPYIQYYTYDEVGNMTEMKHTTTGGTGNWTRDFTIDTTSNRTLENSIGSNSPVSESYDYDARGNMIDGMNHLTSLAYNDDNQLQVVIDASGYITTYYQYDYEGQRVRKVTIDTNTNLQQTRKYFGHWEIYQKIDTGTDTVLLERESLSVMDDGARIALIDTPTIIPSGSSEVQLLRYQFSNHLSTATLELDDSAAVISYEEYYPYGSTSFQSGRSAAEVSLKRYRYTGKERDDESGFYYHGARYYVPWMARWIAVDPLEDKFSPSSPYNYGNNNPIIFEDPIGTQAEGHRTYSTMPHKHGKHVHTSIQKLPMGGHVLFPTHPSSPSSPPSHSHVEIPKLSSKSEHKGFFGNLFDKVKKLVSPVVNEVKSIARDVGNFLAKVGTAIGNFAQRAWEVIKDIGEGAITFVKYAADTFASNILWGAFRPDPDKAKHSGAARVGQFVGDILSLIGSAIEFSAGAGLLALSGATLALSGGGAAPVSAGLAIAGVAVMGHSIGVGLSAIYHMASDASKNERHGDGGRGWSKAEKQIEELEKELAGAPRKLADKIRKKIQRIREEAQKRAKGEEHGRTGKR